MDQLEARVLSVPPPHPRLRTGAEPDPTLWWTRNADKPYHIDYPHSCPGQKPSRPSQSAFTPIGSRYSDHSPVTVDLRVSPRRPRRWSAVNQVADTAGDDSRDLERWTRPRSRILSAIPVLPARLRQQTDALSARTRQPARHAVRRERRRGSSSCFARPRFTAEWTRGVPSRSEFGTTSAARRVTRQARTRSSLEEMRTRLADRHRRPTTTHR